MRDPKLPIAVIGAGPVGLAAAAHLVMAGEAPLVLEAGPGVGANVLEWGHVRLFSPWGYNIDAAAAALLTETGWAPPDPDAYPTGRELVERYLAPLAATPRLAPHLRYNTRVLAVTRRGVDKLKTAGREDAPFLLRVQSADGEEDLLARAVIDASGTWRTPNPLGAGGVPALGERALADRIAYGIPDVLGAERARYAGRRVLVVGSGHSAFNALLDLSALAGEAPGTAITWAVRRPTLGQVFGGGERDLLAARGALGARVRRLVEAGALCLVTGFTTRRLVATDDGIVVAGEDAALPPVDEIIATTGFRPDLTPLGELRLALDPALESPAALAPLIDPNEHSCGTVRPHGAEELRHPERDLYIVGMKSYGRAPTALMLTGYEQARSVVAALTGDWESARDVRLALPETGVCTLGAPGSDPSSKAAEAACCGLASLSRPAVAGCASAGPACATDVPTLQVAAAGASHPAGGCCGSGGC